MYKASDSLSLEIEKLGYKENRITYVDGWAVDCDDDLTNVTLKEGTIGLTDQLFHSQQAIKSATIPSSIKIIPSILET